jgi:hypothetical protein
MDASIAGSGLIGPDPEWKETLRHFPYGAPEHFRRPTTVKVRLKL